MATIFKIGDGKFANSLFGKDKYREIAKNKADHKKDHKNKLPADYPFIKKQINDSLKPNHKPAPEELKKHQELILQISRYCSSARFGEYLKDCGFVYTPATLKGKTVAELEMIMNRIRASMGSYNITKFWNETVIGGVKIVEGVIVSTPLRAKCNIKGLSDALGQNAEFLDALEMLQLENQNITYLPLPMRMALIVSNEAIKCHVRNTAIGDKFSNFTKPTIKIVDDKKNDSESESDDELPEVPPCPTNTPVEAEHVEEPKQIIPKGTIDFTKFDEPDEIKNEPASDVNNRRMKVKIVQHEKKDYIDFRGNKILDL